MMGEILVAALLATFALCVYKVGYHTGRRDGRHEMIDASLSPEQEQG